MQTMLTIAGFDPSSGAGMTADLMVFAAHRCFGTACISALTAQTTMGVSDVYPVAGPILGKTLALLSEDLRPDGVKIGMLANVENVRAVADFVGDLRRQGSEVPVVLDPVMRSSSGRALLSEAGILALRHELLPKVDWLTPNLAELAMLTGRQAGTAAEIEAGAVALQRECPGLNVVVTGGHHDPPDDLVMLADGSSRWLAGVRIESRATHGTGCAFSSALACWLAQGQTGLIAAERAKTYVVEAIRRAVTLGGGYGPMNLLWPLAEAADERR